MPRLDFFPVFTNAFFHNFPFKSKCILKIINIFPERKAAFYQLKFAPARVYKFNEKGRESLSLSLICYHPDSQLSVWVPFSLLHLVVWISFHFQTHKSFPLFSKPQSCCPITSFFFLDWLFTLKKKNLLFSVSSEYLVVSHEKVSRCQ